VLFPKNSWFQLMRTLRLVFIHKPFQSMSQGCEVQVFWCSRIFYPTPEVQLNHCLHRTPKLGIPVETVQLLLKLLWKQNSCCVPRFPLIASCYIIINSWLHSRESGASVKGQSWTFYLRLRNPGCKLVIQRFPQFCSCRGDCGIYYTCAALVWNLAQRHALCEVPI